VHDYVLQVRGPVGPTDDAMFEWQLLDAKSREAVLSGSAGTWDLALQEGLAQSRQDFNLEPGREITPSPGDDDAAKPLSAQSEQMDLVRALLPHTDSLRSVPECAAELLASALVEGAADAGAVLLRDGDAWRVAAGSGLRPLEFRYELTAAHWLVHTVFEAGYGVVVNDTDVARQRFAGAPLAGQRRLMAVPLTSADGLLLLARCGDSPFEDNDLKQVIKVGQEAAAELAEAAQVLLLARTLTRYV